MKKGEHYSGKWWYCENCGTPMRVEWKSRVLLDGRKVDKFCYDLKKEKCWGLTKEEFKSDSEQK